MALSEQQRRELTVSINQKVRAMQPTMRIRTSALIDIGAEKLVTKGDKDALSRRGDLATSTVNTSELLQFKGNIIEIKGGQKPSPPDETE